MKLKPTEIFNEYRAGCDAKSAIGNKGLFEQSRINERFYIGDQWHGARCGNDRPLVRHNIIKRIGEYKISQILSGTPTVTFSADGIPTAGKSDIDLLQRKTNQSALTAIPDNDEVNYVMSAFDNYHKLTAERVKLQDLNERVLKNAYITGTSVLYTYWDSSVATGLYADYNRNVALKGDICCEVLNINDIVFGDPYCEELQKQPYIIISSCRQKEDVIREARLNGADIGILRLLEESAQKGKITVFTKLYKQYRSDGSITVKCVKVTEKAYVRNEFDTGLRLYPLAVFCWERKANSAYGESEVTYLIPNQIAINRMITANVWATMTNGMPIMVVNGDTVTDRITNDPGQIIKVFGSNEDVAGAVKYISPPTFTKDFDESINTLIENTMTQSGANEVALGDSRADNATALNTMRTAALMPLQMIKGRFHTFCEDLARIWADFWITCYGKRCLKSEDGQGVNYIPFDGSRYKNIIVSAKVDVSSSTVFTERERTELLISLYEKGVINRGQLLKRLPEGTVSDIKELISESLKEDNTDERI